MQGVTQCQGNRVALIGLPETCSRRSWRQRRRTCDVVLVAAEVLRLCLGPETAVPVHNNLPDNLHGRRGACSTACSPPSGMRAVTKLTASHIPHRAAFSLVAARRRLRTELRSVARLAALLRRQGYTCICEIAEGVLRELWGAMEASRDCQSGHHVWGTLKRRSALQAVSPARSPFSVRPNSPLPACFGRPPLSLRAAQS